MDIIIEKIKQYENHLKELIKIKEEYNIGKIFIKDYNTFQFYKYLNIFNKSKYIYFDLQRKEYKKEIEKKLIDIKSKLKNHLKCIKFIDPFKNKGYFIEFQKRREKFNKLVDIKIDVLTRKICKLESKLEKEKLKLIA